MAFGVSQTPNINSKAKEKEKARIIALEQVTTKRPNETVIYRRENGNATGVLTAVIDKPNHVSVRPVNPLEMMEWINSRPTAKENPYYLTKILASISIRDNGGPCNVKID